MTGEFLARLVWCQVGDSHQVTLSLLQSTTDLLTDRAGCIYDILLLALPRLPPARGFSSVLSYRAALKNLVLVIICCCGVAGFACVCLFHKIHLGA